MTRTILYVAGTIIVATCIIWAIAKFDIDVTIRVPVHYIGSDLDFPNPERGLYSQYAYDPDGVAGTSAPLQVNDLLRDHDENKTLLLRLYYLSDFMASGTTADPPIHVSPAFIDFLNADFDSIRTAGQKVIVRFAYQYTEEIYPCDIVHERDPGLDQVLTHIADLGPVLAANSDVIGVVQAGFLGTWGEWFYVNSDFADIAVSTPDCQENCSSECQLQSIDYEFDNRRQVVDALLEQLPADRSIQLRIPFYKNEMYGSGGRPDLADAIDLHTFLRSTPGSRIGHHNDCFLAPFKEGGTYSYDPNEENNEKAYLEAETRFVPMGGETCQLNTPASCCDQARQDLARFHWSYLHDDYNNCVLATWGKTWEDSTARAADLTRDGCDPDVWPAGECDGDCYDDIRKNLGYRLRLVSGKFPFFSARRGREIDIRLTLRNDGYAAPFNRRDVELIFRSSRDASIVYAAGLNEEPRFWRPGRDIQLKHRIYLPEDMIEDEYDLLLSLPDPRDSLEDDPRYSIRLANSAGITPSSNYLLWEASTGYNDLLSSVDVSGGPSGEPYVSSSTTLTFLEGEPTPTAVSSISPGNRVEVFDGELTTGFTSTDQGWQYIDVDLGCVIRLRRVRRHMSPGAPQPSPSYASHPAGNRGMQGEHFYCSVDGETWTKATTSTTTGWQDYSLYSPAGSAWYSVDYGWSAWLEFNDHPYARYIRFQWDGNYDTLNEVAINN